MRGTTLEERQYPGQSDFLARVALNSGIYVSSGCLRHQAHPGLGTRESTRWVSSKVAHDEFTRRYDKPWGTAHCKTEHHFWLATPRGPGASTENIGSSGNGDDKLNFNAIPGISGP